MRALVTGASGFIGRYLVRALDREYDAVDRVDIVAPDEAASGETYVADLRDVLPTLPRYDAVFHLAAMVGGRAAMDDGPLLIAGNLALDVSFFDYVARTRPAAAAYLSSSAVYPDDCVDLAEGRVDPGAEHIGRPDGMYGWVKLTGERVAAVVRERYGVPVVCYRPFTVYGPNQGPEYPVTAIAARALAREDPLTLWGSGEQVRDLVYVEDCAAAIAATHRSGVPALNVCTGTGTDFLALARAAAAAVGYSPCVSGDVTKQAGVGRRVGSTDLLRTWCTLDTSVDDGVARVVGWLTRG